LSPEHAVPEPQPCSCLSTAINLGLDDEFESEAIAVQQIALRPPGFPVGAQRKRRKRHPRVDSAERGGGDGAGGSLVECQHLGQPRFLQDGPVCTLAGIPWNQIVTGGCGHKRLSVVGERHIAAREPGTNASGEFMKTE